MRKKREQVTCLCGAYDFPHRIEGGRCSGSSWAESYREVEGSRCDNCSCNSDRGFACDVAGGLEGIRECEGYMEHLHMQPDIRLPIRNVNEHFERVCHGRYRIAG